MSNAVLDPPVARGTDAVSAPAAPKAFPTPPLSAVVLNRICYGPRPGTEASISGFQSLGPTDDARLLAFVERQLNPASIPDADVGSRLSNPAFTTLNKSLGQLWQDHKVDGVNRNWPIEESERAAFVRAVYSNRQLLEMTSEFWHDHFNVRGRDFWAQSVWPSWHRDVIRPNAFGNFRTLLGATATHPAMLYYLDNYINRVAGPNENYAREMIELHTMGAENYLGIQQQADVATIPPGEPGEGQPVGYVDADVYEATRVLTGWRINAGSDGGGGSDTAPANDGSHYYHDAWHDRFQKTVLGQFFTANSSGLDEVPLLLDRLAYHPGTARHIAGKLCRRFISDNPPQEVIDFAANVFWQQRMAPDQIKRVIRAILLFDGTGAGEGGVFVPGCFRDTSGFGGKIKRPFEVLVSAMRATGANFTVRRGDGESDAFMSRVSRTGHRPYDWAPPDGFPDNRQNWQGGTNLVQTWRSYDWVLDENQSSSLSPTDPGSELIPVIAITFNSYSANRALHTPSNLVDYWMRRIFGWAPDQTQGWKGTELHTKITQFMRRNRNMTSFWDADTPIGDGSPFNTDGIETHTGPEYWRTRMRAMVALIVSSPLFMQR